MDQAISSFQSSLEIKRRDQFLNLYQGGSLCNTIKFANHKLIGMFSITKDQKYSELSVSENRAIPQLIPPEAIRRLRGTFLGLGYDKAVLIKDYAAYHELKQVFFLQWLVNNEYFKKVKNGIYKKPDIICFGGRITDPLKTPLVTRYGEWDIFAAKFCDTLFIWDKKTSENRRSKESYYGVAYEALLTGKNADDINEYEKGFVIQEVTFGSHQMLIVSEIDATEEDKWTEIKVYKECSPNGMRAKYLSYWAQNVVPGVNKLVLGLRSESGLIQRTTKLSSNHILRCGNFSRADINSCFEFQDRLLNWMQCHFESNDPKKVKKFYWTGPPSNEIKCSDIDERESISMSMIPDWFIDAVKQKTWSTYFSLLDLLLKRTVHMLNAIFSFIRRLV